jgi:type IV secretory pathway VirB6-like protein
MTDFIVLKGTIMHQITYVYSDKQNGFSEEWKLISSKSEAPQNIVEWVKDHMRGFTGVVNVQYRKDKIIEVGLRLARGGAYIVSAKNPDLLQNIHNVVDKNFWDFSLQNKMDFKPYFTFKCFTNMPIVYLFPQHVLDFLVRSQASRPFYEYYFEPVGKKGMVFLQFMHDDLDEGIKIKQRIETLFILTQFIIYILLISIIVVLFSKWNFKYHYIAIVIAIWLTRYLNPMIANYSLYKGQKQQMFGGAPPDGKPPDDHL